MKRVVQITMACLLMTALIISIVPAVSVPAQAAQRITYKHVVVVGVDGMGNFHNNTDTPNMDRILKNNPKAAWTDYCLASNPNISAQCWTSMLTGVSPNIHGMTNEIVENPFLKYDNPDWPTVFKYIRKGRANAKMAMMSTWIGPANGMVETGLGVTTKHTVSDEILAAESVKYIKENKPDFFFCVFNDVDGAGHSYDWCSDQYYAALTRVDGYVGKIYDAVEAAGMLDDTLFIITTDHGGWTNGHGVRNDDTKYCYFGATGKSINPNKELNVQGRDLAAIICYALNVPGNPKWDSYIPQAMFKDNMTPPVAPGAGMTANHKNIATPSSGADKYIGKYIDTSKLKTALFFDGDVTDHAGKLTASEKGTVKYAEGYFGKAVDVSNGYVSLPDLKFGKDSFAIALWVKKTNLEERNPWDPVIYGNKDWNIGTNPGFVLSEWTSQTRFNVADGSKRSDFNNDFFEGNEANWTHIIVSVDRSANKVRIYYNFTCMADAALDVAFSNMSFDSGLPFNIGQDGTGTYVHKTDSLFDDLLVFNGAITDAQLTGLYNYYLQLSTPEKPKPTTKPTTTKPTTAPTTEPTTVPPTTVPPTVPPATQPTTNPTTIPTTVPVTQAPTVPDSGTNANVDGGLPVGGVIGVIAAVLVVAGVVAFIVIKKKK